jgi:UDP:flavonoid glycosyltransferase YjiC (YdhE family)
VEPADIPDLVVPRNGRVAKFVPYDLLLPMVSLTLFIGNRETDWPQVDVLVNNGGYGAVIQALEHGIPLVVGGEGQDKAITNAIIQWSGVGVHIGGRSPGLDKIRDGLQKILSEPSYTQKAKEMSKNFERYDVGTIVDGVIQDVVRDWAKKQR